MKLNPCLSCGACCAFYRVSFYWGESTLGVDGRVPSELTESLTTFRQCMKGTNQPAPRCVALQGEIGVQARCAIYEMRPTPCIEFGIDCLHGYIMTDKEQIDRCNDARGHFQLSPIRLNRPIASRSGTKFPVQVRRHRIKRREPGGSTPAGDASGTISGAT